MTLVLRAARPNDADALGRILQDWLDATPWIPDLHTQEQSRRFVGRLIAGQTVTVGDWADAPRGFLARDGDSVTALYVDGAMRGRGIGGQLLARAQAEMSRLRLWTFQANTGARAFYLRHGFVEGRQTPGDNDEGLPDVELTWRAGETSA